MVPACDEEAHIGRCVEAIELAASRASVSVDVTVVVVLDRCTDETETVGRASVSASSGRVRWHWCECDAGLASSARQFGLERFLDGLAGDSGDWGAVCVLSTDADTAVPADWISRHVALLDAGDDAVAGIVDLDSIVDLDNGGVASIDHEAWARDYRFEFAADGTHPHVHAANLAVRLDALQAAGGFGHARRAEDIDLWRRLGELDGVVRRSDTSSVVTTSARLDGRVIGGFATALNRLYGPAGSQADRRRQTPS